MALTRCLPVLLLVAMTATTGASGDRSYFDVIKCYPPPTPTADNGSEFRRNLLYLLEVLPRAAAPMGFASLQIAGSAASDRPLVRGLCYGKSAPEPCRRYLSDAGKRITKQCGDASRRAGFWDERCFLGYADGTSSSVSAADDFGSVSFSGDPAAPSPDIASVQSLVALAQSLAQRVAGDGSVATAYTTSATSKGDRILTVLAQCARDRGAADCVRCIREASLTIAESWKVGRVAAVLGSNCYLRFEISTPPLPLGKKIWRMIEEHPVLSEILLLLIVVIVSALIVFACRCRRPSVPPVIYQM